MTEDEDSVKARIRAGNSVEVVEVKVVDFSLHYHPRGLFLTAMFNARRDGDELAAMMLEFGLRLYDAQEGALRRKSD